MNARTYTQAVNPVLAVIATSKFKQQQSKRQPVKRVKKQKTFDSLFQTACNTDNDTLLPHSIGCYGKDAKPVAGHVSSFNQIS